MIISLIAVAGCGADERRAERLRRDAMEAVDAGQLEAAIELLQTVVDDYANTDTAQQATEDLKTYRNLLGAQRNFPVRQARDTMVALGKTLERYRRQHRRYPATLQQLEPQFLERPAVDPWGRPFVYEPLRNAKGYLLACLGEDGGSGGVGADADLHVRDGRFISGAVD